MPHRPARLLAACLTALVLATACAPDPSPSEGEIRQPEPGAVFDYQLGGPYPPDPAVRAVSRDRTAEPAEGLYNVCYVNAFQAQPDAVDWWQEHHPRLLLKSAGGKPVVDESWDEPLLDISTSARREALMDVVGPWIDGCAQAGYDAVEPDNLDSYERSDGRLTPEHATAFAELLAGRAHDRGLAVGQKNTTGLLPHHDRIGFDFAVIEECAAFEECGAFADAYDDKVFAVEYRRTDYLTACRSHGSRFSVTLRDLDVSPRATSGYVFEHC